MLSDNSRGSETFITMRQFTVYQALRWEHRQMSDSCSLIAILSVISSFYMEKIEALRLMK